MNDNHTYSLPEIAALICGDDLKDPERWVFAVSIRGSSVPSRWAGSNRMTQAQLDEAISSLEPQRPASPDVSGPTPTSQRRRTRRS